MNIGYMAVVSPLCLTYIQLILSSFSNKRSNKCKFSAIAFKIYRKKPQYIVSFLNFIPYFHFFVVTSSSQGGLEFAKTFVIFCQTCVLVSKNTAIFRTACRMTKTEHQLPAGTTRMEEVDVEAAPNFQPQPASQLRQQQCRKLTQNLLCPLFQLRCQTRWSSVFVIINCLSLYKHHYHHQRENNVVKNNFMVNLSHINFIVESYYA